MHTEQPVDRLRRQFGLDEDAATADEEAATAGEQPDTSLSRWLPEVKPRGAAGWLAAARADPGRAGVVALALVGVVAVLVTVFTLVRDRPAPVVAAKLPPVEMAASAPSAPSASSSAGPAPPAAGGPVVVSVVGLVHKPGLVTLDSGARIADALSAAGGTLDGADLMGLNMARRVADGEQIIVGMAAPPGEPTVMGSAIAPGAGGATTPAPTAANASAVPGAPVDLNTATAEELDALPGVGPVTAAAIIAWRGAHGRFGSVDQLADVDGIGPARLDKLRDLVRV